jgi:SAM-dependent methyltransferase
MVELVAQIRNRMAASAPRRVLHVGCGVKSHHRLHALFRNPAAWSEVRADVDANVAPDLICSAVDMRQQVASGSYDALWSSHTIEHLYDHEIPLAFSEFLRVLKPGGFVLIRCPDLAAIVEAIHAIGPETVAYMSPAGPITPLDMLFGHRAAIARGNGFMAHHTAFTDERLGQYLVDAGFASVVTKRADHYDLWAVAFTEEASMEATLADLAMTGLDFRN